MLDAQLFLPPRSVQLREYCNHEYHDKLLAKEGRKEGRKERTNERTHRAKKNSILNENNTYSYTNISTRIVDCYRSILCNGYDGRTHTLYLTYSTLYSQFCCVNDLWHIHKIRNFNCCFTVHFDKYKTILPTNALFY